MPTYIALQDNSVHRWFVIDSALKVHIVTQIEDLIPLSKLVKKCQKRPTYIELPDNFVHRWFGVDAAFKVHIVSLFDAIRIQGGAKSKFNPW